MKNKAQIKLKWKLEEMFITDITAKIGIHNVSHLQSNIKNVGNTIKKWAKNLHKHFVHTERKLKSKYIKILDLLSNQ